MWKNLSNQLDHYQNTLSVRDYCVKFLEIANPQVKIWDLTCLDNKLNKSVESSIFPEMVNLHNYFNEGDYEFIVNFIYHFPNLNLDWYDFNSAMKSLDENEIYLRIFDEENEEFLFSKSRFMPDLMLSKDTYNRILSFLFLFFLPVMKNCELLYHHRKKIPLLSCWGITNTNFDMLLYLMKKYDKFGIDMLSKHRNLNHLLVEEFMSNAVELYSFNESIDWNKILPIYKVETLLDLNCGFSNFEDTMPDRFKFTFEQIPQILKNIELEYRVNKLENELNNNNSITKKKTKV